MLVVTVSAPGRSETVKPSSASALPSAARSSPPRSASTGSLTTVSGATRTATRDKSARAGPESGAACGTECAHAANSSTAAHTFTLLRRDLHLRIRLDAALVALRLHLGEV